MTGDHNTCVGGTAGTALTTGAQNVAIGSSAGDGITSTNGNVAVGHGALSGAHTNTNTIAIGWNAGESWTDGAGNVAVGAEAAKDMTTGTNNTLIGYRTMYGTVAADDPNSNTLVGYLAGTAIRGADNNTCIGDNAGATITTGDNNTCIGKGAAVSSADSTLAIAIGYNCMAHDDGSYMSIGTGTGTDRWWIDFGSSNTWARESDERLKKNIEDSSLGLDFVNDLRAVKYQWKTGEEQSEDVRRYNKEGELQTPLKPELINYGMIAQEVKSALDTAGVDDFGGWSEDKDGIQALSVSSFVIPLIKAVQELTAKVKALEDAQ